MKRLVLASLVIGIAAVALVGVLQLTSLFSGEPAGVLRVYLLAGQSNMEGRGYTHQEGDDWLARIGAVDATSLEFLLRDSNYRLGLDRRYTFLWAFDSSWMEPRDDVWVIHMDSQSGETFHFQPTRSDEQDLWEAREGMLQPGFGLAGAPFSRFGPELGLGHHLGKRLDDPIYLYKSDHGGTSLALDWRPPSAARARGGEVGAHYTHTVDGFRAFCARLDAELAEHGSLEAYGGAESYEVAAFVWLQGYQDAVARSTADEYEANLMDLIRDLRTDLDLSELPLVVIQGTDRNYYINTARLNVVKALNLERHNSAALVKTHRLHEGRPHAAHFEFRAENYVEVGWRVGRAILDRDMVGGSPAR